MDDIRAKSLEGKVIPEEHLPTASSSFRERLRQPKNCVCACASRKVVLKGQLFSPSADSKAKNNWM